MFATIGLLGGLDMRKCFNCMNDLPASEEKCPACGTVYDNTPRAEYHLPPETILADRYIIGYAIKETEVFIAYMAWDKEENKKVIINEYFPAFLSERTEDLNVEPENKKTSHIFVRGLAAFRDECIDLKDMPNADVIGGFEQNNTYYCVREIVDGIMVKNLIYNDLKLSGDYARRVLILILRSLNKIQKKGIIHGNITPETLYISKKDTSIILTDFRFSGYLSPYLDTDCNDGYSPLEQYEKNTRLDLSADVYSVGAVFYEMISKEKPASAVHRLKADTLVAPTLMGINIKKNIENAMFNALNLHPEHRTKNVTAFYEELKNPETPRKWERNRKKYKKKAKFSFSTFKDAGFWTKVGLIGIFGIMFLAVIATAVEVAFINHKTKNPTDAEISTEAVPRSEDITFNIVTVTEEQSETTTEEKQGFFDKIFGGNDDTDVNENQREQNRTTNKKSTNKPKDKVTSGSSVR